VPEDFQSDVFLSHSTKDKPVVRELVAWWQRDGVRAGRDEEQITLAANIPAKIEKGLGVTEMETNAAITFACQRRIFSR
jgi:hypothetical protein